MSSTAGEVSHILINYSGPSFSYLPRDILVNILHKLSVKRIFLCKAVCKTWNDLISDPEFAKFHYEHAEAYPLIRIPELSGNPYLVQPEKDGFDVKLGMCDHKGSNSECACHVKVELDTKLKLPKCIDFEQYSIVNSCNGLLCLSDPSDSNFIICNPITGEFMELPEAKKFEELGYQRNFGFTHGFGFSPATNEYKVIRICQCGIVNEKFLMRGIVVEIHILGTDSWKNMGFIRGESCEPCSPIYSNGFLYWFSTRMGFELSGFDIEKECLVKVPKPPLSSYIYDCKNIGAGVFGGEFCMTCIDKICLRSAAFTVWVMKECGDKQEWSNILSIELHSNIRRLDGPYQPIKYLNDGALLLFQPYNNAFIYKDPKKLGFRYLEVCGIESTSWMRPEMKVIAHTPSFVSLKHALSLSGQNVKVLNVKSRCAELQNQEKVISIEEKEVEGKLEYDWGSSSESEDRDLEFDSDSEDRKISIIDMQLTADSVQEGDHGVE